MLQLKPAKCGEGIKYKKEKYKFKGKQCERMVCDDDDTDPIKICPMPRCRQAPPNPRVQSMHRNHHWTGRAQKEHQAQHPTQQ